MDELTFEIQNVYYDEEEDKYYLDIYAGCGILHYIQCVEIPAEKVSGAMIQDALQYLNYIK